MKFESILKHFTFINRIGDGRFMALCPAHRDKNPSLSISQGSNGRTVLNCLAGCKTEDVLKAVGLEMKDLFPNDQTEKIKDVKTGCTFQTYIKAKKVPESFLRGLGIDQGFYMGKPCLVIPYFNENGNQAAVRYRTGLNGNDKFRWRKGAKPCLYGLNKLSDYNKSAVFLIEGESDCHTLWFNGIQALGLPGANNWREDRDAPILNKFDTVYVIIEPDAGGKAVLRWMKSSAIKNKVKLVSLPTNDVSELYIKNKDSFKEIFQDCVEQAVSFSDSENQDIEPENSSAIEWDKARELFPRIEFPWEVLPAEIKESLQQLARSHATSPLSLPGAAVAVFASVLGATVNVSPKKTWTEPLIFWFADIRPSGSGKTPAARALCKVLYDAQIRVDDDYKQRVEEELIKKPKDRNPVPRSKSYFITDLTLEGLRADAIGHGGSVCVLDELSSFINGQNQYKAKGNDREAWLSLHDGNSARIVRAKESFTVSGARISIIGGIQPVVWQMSFGSEKGLFLADGTAYRFLNTYEGDRFYKLTAESWSDLNREVWEQMLIRTMKWANTIVTDEDWKPKTICLSDDAQELFFEWRNQLYASKKDLPDQLTGYIPKIIGYSLRLAGALYCMKHFTAGNAPGNILDREDMQNGIDAVTFYSGHIVDAAKSLCSKKPIIPLEITDQVKHLAKTLESLRGKVDNERLAVGYIQEQFNLDAKPEYKIKTPRAMGVLLRKCSLTLPPGHFRANKKAMVKCLLWNKKTDSFLKQCLQSLQVYNTVNHAVLEVKTLETQSLQSLQNASRNAKPVDFVDIEKTKSTHASLRASSDVDIVDIVDFVSKENEKTELESTEFEEGVI